MELSGQKQSQGVLGSIGGKSEGNVIATLHCITNKVATHRILKDFTPYLSLAANFIVNFESMTKSIVC